MAVNAAHTVLPTTEHTHTIIFLHGRDSTADEFADEFFESQATDDRTLPEIFPSFKWGFPVSKHRRSARFETELSQWFDIWSIENPEQQEEIQTDGLKESVQTILELVSAESCVVPSQNIILAGISQGCAPGIHALLGSKVRLGGFIGLCGRLPFQSTVELKGRFLGSDYDQQESLSSPVFLRTLYGRRCRTNCKRRDSEKSPAASGLGAYLESYEDGGHWINEPKGVDDIVEFIKEKVL